MLVVPLKKLKTGVLLSEDVRDASGRLLLTKGTAIDASHIRLLGIWGVFEVHVPEGDLSGASEKSDKDTDKMLKIEGTLNSVLQNLNTDHPAIQSILEAATEYRYNNDLFIDFGPREPLPESFKLSLHGSVKTQIHFSEIHLPESPEIIAEFNKMVDDPMSSAHDVAAVVSRSPSLAALILKIANSPAYGLASKVDTLSRAVTVLGTQEVGALAVVISSLQFFRNVPKDIISMSTFLRHSLACGLLSRILCAQANLPHTERLFLAGLLHDIGRLVLYRYFSEQAKLALHMAKRTGLSVLEIEKACLGIDHAQIAGELLKKWNFPETLINAIVHHHNPSQCREPAESSIVHMADIAVNALGLGHSGGFVIPCFDPEGWNQLGIAPVTLKTAIAQTVQQLDIMTELFVGF